MRRNKKLAKVLTGTLATAMLVSGTVPAYAAAGTSGNTSTGSVVTQEAVEGTNAVNVYAEIGSQYTVTIPKTITLDGATKTGAYTVSVAGDIAGNETVKVVPDTSFAMSQTGKADVTASIEQDKTSWKVAEFGTNGTGSITASGLTAGTWNGTFNFNVGLEAEQAYGKNITLTSNNLSTYGIATSGDVVIPSEVTDSEGVKHKITGIEENAFIWCTDLTSVTIPDSVTSIGAQAFSGLNKLTSIIVDKNNKVYDSRNNCNAIIETATNTLIQGCNNSTIPDDVISIEKYAFFGCSSLTSVAIPDSVINIGNGAFSGCTDLTSIEIPNSVTSIGNYAFQYCNLASIEIPNSVISIGNYAFLGCKSLTTIEIPDSVTNIGMGLFADCSKLETIVVDEENSVYDSRDNSNAIIETTTNTLIGGCKNTTIPDSVTSIDDYAFYECSDLTSVTIPSSVTSIGNNAFYRCGITSIEIPSSVTSIGNGAFSECSSITSIEIPDSVTSIGDGAFSECSSITSIEIPDSVTSIGSRTFWGCTNLTSIEIPNGVTNIGMGAFYYCSSLTTIEIPDSVKSIGMGVFYDCSKLTSVIYKGVTYTNVTELTNALKTNGVNLGNTPFANTKLTA